LGRWSVTAAQACARAEIFPFLRPFGGAHRRLRQWEGQRRPSPLRTPRAPYRFSSLEQLIREFEQDVEREMKTW